MKLEQRIQDTRVQILAKTKKVVELAAYKTRINREKFE